MSFSSEVRGELCDTPVNARHCRLAELAALLNTAGTLTPSYAIFNTENPTAAQRFQQLLQDAFNTEGLSTVHGHTHTVTLQGAEAVSPVLHATGCKFTPDGVQKEVNPLVVMGQCCKRAYIRGSFIAGGTVSDPKKTYHMEFVLPPPTGSVLAEKLTTILLSFELHPKIHQRKAHTVVYVKEAEDIVNLLNIMGAHRSLLRLENVRILKEIGNTVNRKVNFETANLNKTVNAAVSQIADIRFIAEHTGLGYLSEPLEEVARLRLQYESASLKEIGGMLKQPLGKSGVNHRLRKISLVAENLKRERPDYH